MEFVNIFSSCIVVLLTLSANLQPVTSHLPKVTRDESSPKVHYGSFNTTSFTLEPSKDTGCLLKTIVFHPTALQIFQPIFFIGGVSGTIPSEAYSELLSSIASAGYVVMGINRFNMLDTSPTSRAQALAGPQTFADQMNWLIDLLSNSTTRPPALVYPAFNKTSLLCHSEGCDLMLQILDRGLGGIGNLTKSVVYIDPFSVASGKLPMVEVQIPSLSFMSALSESFPPCCIKGIDYRQFYKLMPCQKVRMNVAGFGHCDLLDPKWWQVCHLSHVCVTTNSSRLPGYRMFLQREVTSFIRWAVDGDISQLKFFTDKSYIPFPVLDLAYDDTKCDNSTDDSGREERLDMFHFVPEANLYDKHKLDRDVRLEE